MAKHSLKCLLVLFVLFIALTLTAGTALAPAAGVPGASASAPCEVTLQETETAGTYDINRIDEAWTMSDGTTLPVSVFNPVPKNAGETFPVIVCIHGWGGDKTMSSWTAEYYARKGYIGVAMTCRGWLGAGGEIGIMDPEHDVKDISDIITLVDGDTRLSVLRDEKGPMVGVTGYSMGGCFSYLLAPRQDPRPGDPCDPRVRAVVPMHGSFDLIFSLYPNDALKFSMAIGLLSGSYMGNIMSLAMNLFLALGDDSMGDWQKLSTVLQSLGMFLQQPINNVTPLLPFLFEVVTQRLFDKEAEARQIAKVRSARYWCDEEYDGKVIEHPITVPMLILCSFNDSFFYSNEGLMAFNSAVGPKRIVITNAGHGGDGAVMSGGRFPLSEEHQWILDQVDNWFDHYLKGVDNGAESEPRICYYRDRDPANYGLADEYPLPGTSTTTYYLDRDKLSTNGGDDGMQSDIYLNIGFTGTISIPEFFESFGELGGLEMDLPDKIEICEIPFTEHSYLTDPLPEDVTIMGAPQLILYYSSTHSMAQLDPSIYEVAPDGTETLVSRGWFEGIHGEAWSMVDTSDKPIEMQAFYHCFEAGSRIKLEITTADLISAWPNFTPSITWLFHDAEYRSQLLLPVVPNTY